MAKQIWNDPIDKTVNWGGDENTKWQPVSGDRVQEFIKNTLDHKVGLIVLDEENERYLAFADEASKQEYDEDPTKTHLVLAQFSAGGGSASDNTAEILLSTPAFNAISLNDKGNYLDFTFDIKNAQGNPTGESVVITYTFIRNANKQTFTQIARMGQVIHLNIDKYLGEGINTVIINVRGQITMASTTASVTYQVVNMQISDEMDISVPYDLSEESKVLEIPFTVSGSGTKIVEWYLDGELLDFVKNEDEVVDIRAERTKFIQLANLQQGRHSLQIRAYTTINGERFYTPTLYRDVIVYTGANNNTIIAIAIDIPVKYGLVEGQPILYGVTQYVPYNLRFATYSPSNKLNTPITVALDGESLGMVNSQNGIENQFGITAKKSGNTIITLTESENNVYAIPSVIDATTMSIEEITNGLKLDFSAIGRTNSSTDKDMWSYGDFKGTFSGINWNESSGWVNNRLLLNPGASFSIDYAPLANNPTNLGRTLEFEFMTTNVNDDNAVICDLRENGVGVLITATKVSVTSEAGVVVENEFKANENVRIGIVIHRSAGSTRKGLTFIYANGCVSRCNNWGVGDSYQSNKQITFSGSMGAEVQLKSIRIYEAALTDDNMLNNYILYRDSVEEMHDVYDRNDIYNEGTTTFSPDKMVSRLPVMMITGDIPVLENTSDKDTQIIVDIEYTNVQDPSRSFKMVGAAMRPQGTSSMGYPKKNFRIYTQEVADTILYDADGNVVEDKLYSFRKNAIPVNCWCLKADYAESSGTHNTGIARMWNKALYNMQINKEYVCRTEAQKAALASGYKYDVRTTIDGFPILLFYKKNPSDEPIFIGKYNFNNDKSTEKVFGFTDIPGFDNSRMQCWEVLNNGNSIGLFTDISNFYNDVTSEGKTKKGWEFAFESRYPDTKSPNTDDLYNFAVWMNGVNGDHERFATEKWDHFKIYPMAAYYCYIMRHAAADQLVKNAMFTSEDGQKFYYILYDNDTINGLINTGDIDILPTDDRDSKNESGEYKFAGHSSVLWNMLEADSEFMQIVKDVDDALYSAGISYNDCIRTFDEEQADKWVERVYNQDSEYKYIGPYTNKGINNLEMLQGRRDLHRRWWLSKRFSIYDAKFVSGEYKSQAIELKCMNDTPKGQKFSIKAGYPLDYGFGINDVPRKSGVYLAVGESYTFEIAEAPFRGDPIRIYGAPNIAELDLSSMANRLAEVNIANVYTEALGTKLKKFILGGEGVNNLEVSEISGLKQAKMLTHLDVRGMHGIKSLDLTSQPYFEELKAIGSEVASVTFAKGAPVNRLELPATMKVLNLEQLPYLTSVKLLLADITGIHTINVKGCPNLSKDFTWIKSWYDRKSTVDSKCTLIMDNIDWTGVNVDDIINIGRIGTLELKGKVVLENITLEQINTLIEVFGETVFDRNADFFIDAPNAIYLVGRTEMLEGETEDYNCIVFGSEIKRITWLIYTGGNSYTSIDPQTGVLTVLEGAGDRNLVIRAVVTTDKETRTLSTEVAIKARVYPEASKSSISGPSNIELEKTTYTLVYNSETEITGNIEAEWSLSGMDGYVEIEYFNDSSCVLKKVLDTYFLQGELSCLLKKRHDGSTLFTLTKKIEILDGNIAETEEEVVTVLYNAGLCSNTTYITKDEAALITDDNLRVGYNSIFKNTNIKSFNGFKYFIRVTGNVGGLFMDCSSLTTLELPPNMTTIGGGMFDGCHSLVSLDIPEGVTSIRDTAFYDCPALTNLRIPKSLTEISNSCFYNCHRLSFNVDEGNNTFSSKDGVLFNSQGDTLLKYLKDEIQPIYIVPNGTTIIENMAFNNCTYLTSLELPDGLTTIGKQAFTGCNFTEVIIPDTVTSIGSTTFSACKSLKNIVLPNGITTIESSLFANCSSLESIEIPESVTMIRETACYNCTAVTTIKVYCAVAPTVMNTAFGNVGRDNYNTGKNKLYIPSNGTGYDASYWLDPLQNPQECGFTLSATLPAAIPAHIAEVDPGICKALYDAGLCANETYITKDEAIMITNSDLVNISSALQGNQNIVSFNGFQYFTGVSSLPNSLFYNCTKLESIILPESITSIGSQCFESCSSLKSITLPINVTQIGVSCFKNCAGLEQASVLGQADLPNKVFQFCRALKTVNLLGTFKFLGNSSFEDCTSLETVEFPSSVTKIGDYSFYGCSSLRQIILKENVQSLGAMSFAGCINLSTIYSYRTQAPYTISGSTFGNSNTNAVGANTALQNINILYVPTISSGYESAAWQELKMNGFTISNTL